MSSGGPPGQILAAWERSAFQLLVSPDLLIEYRRVLGYDRVRSRHRMTDDQLDELVSRFANLGVVVHPVTQLDIVAGDPDDNRILECASAGTAAQIVSGDPHLLTLESHEDIPIITPRAFLDLIEGEDGA